MRNYRERLGAPASWWLLGEFTAVTLASTAWAGFSLLVAIACYVLFCAVCAVALLAWGAVTIEVTDGDLHAGRGVLSLADAGQVVALDEAQFRELRGPRADPSARLLIRPYLRHAVYIEIAGENAQITVHRRGAAPARPRRRRRLGLATAERHAVTPYWLIATRRPDELAAAIERSRPQARAGEVPVR